MISPLSMMGLKKALYIIISDLLGKLFFVIDIPLLTLEIALSVCCLKIKFFIKY